MSAGSSHPGEGQRGSSISHQCFSVSAGELLLRGACLYFTSFPITHSSCMIGFWASRRSVRPAPQLSAGGGGPSLHRGERLRGSTVSHPNLHFYLQKQSCRLKTTRLKPPKVCLSGLINKFKSKCFHVETKR